MAALQICDLAENVYRRIEQQAKANGVTVAEQAVTLLARAVDDTVREDQLLAETRKEREELAARGIFATPELIDDAKRWGRR